jgi:hypothetical protein
MEQSTETYLNHKGKGFIKVWAVNPKTGDKSLLVDKSNLILNGGADLLAQALAGVSSTGISHIYVGYNTFDGTFTAPVIDREYSVKFPNYGSGSYDTYGYLRLPLAYTPSFIGQTGYDNNVVVFTAIISSAGNAHGADFVSSADAGMGNPASQIFEVGLVAALDPTSSAQDVVFSRANFTPLLYDPNFNLTITWGVQFLA